MQRNYGSQPAAARFCGTIRARPPQLKPERQAAKKLRRCVGSTPDASRRLC